MIPAMPAAFTLPKSATSLWCDRSTTNGLIATGCNLRRRFMVQCESVTRDDFFPRQLIGEAPAHDQPHIALVDEPAHPAAEFWLCVNMNRDPQSASYSVRLLGCGCGASAVSITRRLFAPSQSSCGGRTPQATDYAPALAAPVAATKERSSSIQAGQAIILASVRFRPTSGDYRGSPENVCSSVDNRSSAAGGKRPFSTAASAFSNCCGVAMPTRMVPIAA